MKKLMFVFVSTSVAASVAVTVWGNLPDAHDYPSPKGYRLSDRDMELTRGGAELSCKDLADNNCEGDSDVPSDPSCQPGAALCADATYNTGYTRKKNVTGSKTVVSTGKVYCKVKISGRGATYSDGECGGDPDDVCEGTGNTNCLNCSGGTSSYSDGETNWKLKE